MWGGQLSSRQASALEVRVGHKHKLACHQPAPDVKKQSYLLTSETAKLLLDNVIVVVAGGVRWWGGV